MPSIRATDVVWWAVGNPIVAAGNTQDGVTITGLSLVYNEDEVELLEDVAGQASNYHPLPANDWVDGDAAYGYNTDLIIVRQAHQRAGQNPDDDDTRYTTKNSPKKRLWIPNEQVHKGLKRYYDSIRYKCLVAHLTAIGLEPPNAPTYWGAK
jgi:hypothetical protein